MEVIKSVFTNTVEPLEMDEIGKVKMKFILKF